jgi:hypothetical protein
MIGRIYVDKSLPRPRGVRWFGGVKEWFCLDSDRENASLEVAEIMKTPAENRSQLFSTILTG